MIFDSLDVFTFTTAGNVTAVIDSNGRKTGATINSTGGASDAFDTVNGGTGRIQPMYAVVRGSAVQTSGGPGVCVPVLQVSDDGATSSDRTSGASATITMTSTPTPFTMSLPITSNKRYYRLNFPITGGATGPVLTIYSADFNVSDL